MVAFRNRKRKTLDELAEDGRARYQARKLREQRFVEDSYNPHDPYEQAKAKVTLSPILNDWLKKEIP